MLNGKKTLQAKSQNMLLQNVIFKPGHYYGLHTRILLAFILVLAIQLGAEVLLMFCQIQAMPFANLHFPPQAG
jgi:hypothetical protein